MTKSEKARNYFLNGYNCAQAVALAFCEETGMDEKTLAQVTLALGGGLGKLRETCGTVSGAAVVLGLIFPEKSKNEIYGLVQKLAFRFKEEKGSYNCMQLLLNAGLPVSTSLNSAPHNEEYYKKRPCPELAACSAAILEQIIAEENLSEVGRMN